MYWTAESPYVAITALALVPTLQIELSSELLNWVKQRKTDISQINISSIVLLCWVDKRCVLEFQPSFLGVSAICAIFLWCHLSLLSVPDAERLPSLWCRQFVAVLQNLRKRKVSSSEFCIFLSLGSEGHCQFRSNYHRSGVRQDANWGEECQKESAICPSQYDMMTSSKSPFRLTGIPFCLLEYLEAWAWAGMSNCTFPSSDCQAGGGRLWSRNTTCLKQELELQLQMRQE